MAFREVQFPRCIRFGVIGGPGFSTDVVTVLSGQEKRNANWSKMRHAWECAYAVKSQTDFEAVRAFFLSVQGRKDGFRFRDWADYTVSEAQGVVAGLTSTTFQLRKQYVSGDVTTLRDIQKPIAQGLVLRDLGTPLVLTTDYTLDATTGIVTTTAPRTAGNLTWSGEFDVPARFDVDELRATIVNRNTESGLLLEWTSVPIVEIRL